jgi:hypothetical protein
METSAVIFEDASHVGKIVGHENLLEWYSFGQALIL